MARARMGAADAADKWSRRTQSAGQDYQAGVQKATGWQQNAIAASARRDAGLQAAMADGRINAGIQRAGDAKWREATLGKGVQNWTGAVGRSSGRYQAGYQRLMGYLDQADAATSNMGRDTVEARVARAGQYQLAVHRAAVAAKRGG